VVIVAVNMNHFVQIARRSTSRC